MLKTDILIAFCIFQYVDPQTRTYRAYLGDSVLERDNVTGSENFVCKEPDPMYRGWFIASRFLAVNPMPSHPIPNGMKLFCVKQTTGFPYDSIDVYIEYDPFNIEDNSVYFIAYTQRVPFTIPLYFHKYGSNNVFPSFDPNPPSTDSGWSQAEVSPVYVISPSMFRDYKPKDIPFKCVNEKCIPWARDIPFLYDNTPDNETTTLDKCILLCSGLGLVNEGVPKNLIDNIHEQEKNTSLFMTQVIRKNTNNIGIVILTCVLVFLIGIFLYKNKNKFRKKYTK